MNREGSLAPLDEEILTFLRSNLEIRLPEEKQLKAKDKNSVKFY